MSDNGVNLREAKGIAAATSVVFVGLLAVVLVSGLLMFLGAWLIEWMANWNWPDMRPN